MEKYTESPAYQLIMAVGIHEFLCRLCKVLLVCEGTPLKSVSPLVLVNSELTPPPPNFFCV